VVIFDRAKRQTRIDELEEQVNLHDFWNDQGRAKQVLAEIKTLKTPIETYTAIQKEFEDVHVFLQLGQEEQDTSIAPEITTGLQKLEKDLEHFQIQLLLNQPYDRENAIITLLAGAGGTDAQDWAEMLLRMYTRWAEIQGYAVEMIDLSPGEEAGLKSATLLIKGPYAYGYLKAERGVHRLVRLSPYNANSKRQTSFAALEVIPDVADDISVEIRQEDLRVDTYRASGAGGQHINKTDSAVRITHQPTGIVVQCQSNRSQIMNREMAMRLLYAKLYQLMQEQHQQEISKLKGAHKEVAWGNQIRSYVLHPYSMVKDHRTEVETAQVQDVLDGDLDMFIQGYLKQILASSR
jgi:peptide chain release factor 2